VRDVADRADIEELVDAFYRAVFADPLIGPIFTEVARVDPQRHFPVMYDFWDTVLFGTGSYRRNALQAHLALNARHPLEEAHFARWLELWGRTLDERFAGPHVERAKLQAGRIAGSIGRRVAGHEGGEPLTILTTRPPHLPAPEPSEAPA
jgi:hemoglobin